MAFIQSHPPGRALDLGCGTGTNAITLAAHGWEVTGVDFSRRAIQIARRKARQAEVNLSLILGDVLRLDGVSGSFDLILDIGCFHSLSKSEVDKYIHNLKRLLAMDGTLLMYGFYKISGVSRPGILEEDVNALSENLVLTKRQDGIDRGQRSSAWFTFQRMQ